MNTSIHTPTVNNCTNNTCVLNAMADYKRDLPWEDFRQSMIGSGRVNMEY